MFDQRINKLREILREKKIDALLISNFFNIFYLTGFRGLSESEREAWVLITGRDCYLFTDARYVDILSSRDPKGRGDLFRNDINIKLITREKKLLQHLEEIIRDEKINSLGFEGEDLKFFEYQGLNNKFNKIVLVPTTQLIVRLREIKEIKEIEKLKKAAEIGDKCLTDIVKTIKNGQKEKEIAWKIEKWLKEKGYDYSFYPIIAFDENSAIPHYDTKAGSNKKLKKGSVILIDFGVKYQGYCSDITRMFFLNRPKTKIMNIYNILLATQQKTINLLTTRRSSLSYKDIDEYCRQQLAMNKHQLTYPHSTGHGVGLEVHEYPKLSLSSEDILQSNQIFTVEPGIYFERKWGMRIEDTILFNKKCGVEVLTKFSKGLMIIK